MANFQLAADLLTAIFNGITDKIRDKYYPIGTIYMSLTNKNPSTFIGGTWVEIQGVYLVGQDPNTSMAHKTLGATIGSWDTKNHTLSIDEIPSHSHLDRIPHTGNASQNTSGDYLPYGGWNANANSVSYYIETSGTGGGKGHHHEFCPPSLVVKIYKRTK